MKATEVAVKRRIASGVIAIALVVLGILRAPAASGELPSGHDLPHDPDSRLVAGSDPR